VIIAFAVAGNTAVITPLFAAFVADVDPETVKKLAATPVNVYVDSGVIVIVAVYAVPWANVPDTVGFHVTVAEYWPFVTIDVSGVAPATGAVKGIDDIDITAFAVAGNADVITPLFAAFVADVDPVTVKKFIPTPVSV